jgi:hypothetical protein
MKKGLTVMATLTLLVNIFAPSVSAQDTSVTPAATDRRRLIKEKVVDKINARITGKKERLTDKIKDRLGRIVNFGARITGNLAAISSSSLTVNTADGKNYTVDITNAQCRRRFGGKCEWSELAVGDRLNVIGKWTDDSKTTINAKLVRDASIQKRHGVVFGKVTAKGDASFTMDVKKGGETLTVTVYTGSAKFINRKEEVIAYGDIQIGHRVRAKGLWDRTLKEMRETTEVKDFDIPAKGSALMPTPTTAATQ